MLSPDPDTPIEATGAELVAYLTKRGHSEVDGKPIAKALKQHGTAALTGVVQRHRAREWAKAKGANPCGEHPEEFGGSCPWCLGLWALPKER